MEKARGVGIVRINLIRRQVFFDQIPPLNSSGLDVFKCLRESSKDYVLSLLVHLKTPIKNLKLQEIEKWEL